MLVTAASGEGAGEAGTTLFFWDIEPVGGRDETLVPFASMALPPQGPVTAIAWEGGGARLAALIGKPAFPASAGASGRVCVVAATSSSGEPKLEQAAW